MKDNGIPQSSYPRERLLHYGAEALSNQELLAILLRTGSHPFNVIELAGQILNEFEDLYELKARDIGRTAGHSWGRPDQSDRTQSYRRTWRPHPTSSTAKIWQSSFQCGYCQSDDGGIKKITSKNICCVST